MVKTEERTVVQVLSGRAAWPPPVWLMRQAGRYLPEYRALRQKAGSFWAMCMNPEMAAEITLQPIRRFGFDAAILFSDILVVPYAMGVPVTFEEGVGPSLPPIATVDALTGAQAQWVEALAPVYETLRNLRVALEPKTTLLGFAGAPWTLATYLAEGHGSSDQRAAKLWAYRDPDGFQQLIDRVGDCVAAHLIAQLDAGADAVQLFDSWAGGLTEDGYARWVVKPTRRIVDRIHAVRPGAKIIGFPRASTLAGYKLYAVGTKVDAVSVDTAAPQSWMSGFAEVTTVQGNLDPLVLMTGGAALDIAVDEILNAMRGKPFIFNLGHGVLPETPLENVARLVQRVRQA